ncbi:uncharacterized protein LOC129597564 [Paramacrobiotus metropolitanus]|uniref:uncharacterized protein LOC129597564 n=1 Tax=Paramacrobiotus metropolitanus TaxID=2943436 RepID=UPI002445E677|nr:uncharacterized protein LOC129597564 [Paramacrobiotus metropolitanus]
MESRIPVAVFVQGQASEANIVDLWEQRLHCDGAPLDLQRIATGLASLITSREKAKKVMKILRDYQTSDPRPSAQYRGFRWCVYNVAGVDVAKLNRFCLSFIDCTSSLASMYIYELRPDGCHPSWQPTKQSLNAWNAVNVDVDGVLQVGHVIGLDDTTGALPQLIIDFGCATQHSVLVEYGKVFNPCEAQPATETRENEFCSVPAGDDYEDVQVLLRSHLDQSWKWYPAKLILSGFEALSDYALVPVEVMVGGVHARELLPYEQICPPPSGEDLQLGMVRPGDFIIRTCSVPPGYWTTAEPAARDLFRQKLENVSGKEENDGKGLRILAVLSQTITYLQRSSESPVSEEDSAELWNEAERDAKPKETEITEYVEKTKRKQPLRIDEVGCLALPPEIVAEILRSLDTIERLRCRRVCHLWNEIGGTVQRSLHLAEERCIWQIAERLRRICLRLQAHHAHHADHLHSGCH